jgi:hypothetical protein
MKKKLAILLATLVGAGVMFNPAAKAISFDIAIGDRPYYEGPGYWDYGWYWVWVPGHWHHREWVHGYYERRGSWNREHFREHHNWHHHHHDHDHDHDHH